MYKVEKTVSISAAHHLTGKSCPAACQREHGHNWRVTVTVQASKLVDGMVVDFGLIKDAVHALDHENLNDHFPNPTAENIAFGIAEVLNRRFKDLRLSNVPRVSRVRVEETEGNVATYEV